jgi:hypothetical protein
MNSSRKTKRTTVKAYTAGPSARSSAEFLLKEILSDKDKTYLIPSYFSSLCLGIESVVNDAYIDLFYRKIGAEYKEHVRIFLYMRFKEKLSTMILLASDFKYQLNEKDKDIKGIFKIVEFRNQLLHAKQHWNPSTKIIENDAAFDGGLDNPDHSDFYSDPKTRGEWLNSLEDYMRLHNWFVQEFGTIGQGVLTRRDYKPRSWLKKVTRK